MRFLTTFNFEQLGEGRKGQPAKDRVVEGNPQFTTWEIDKHPDGTVRTGVWEVTPGAYRSIKGETWEFCSILSGVSEIIEDGKAPVRVTAGDVFVMKPGFVGTWKVIETTRKVWVVKA